MKSQLSSSASARALARAFNAQMVNTFRMGLALRDPEMVEKALKAGVPPETQTDELLHPLQSLLSVTYPSAVAVQATELDRETYEANTEKIIDLLFAAGLRVMDVGKYENSYHAYLVDSLLLMDDVVNVSTVVMHAIRESLLGGDADVYVPDAYAHIRARMDYATHVTGEGGTFDKRLVINDTLNALETLHNIVRARILNPLTDTDRELALCKDELEDWTDAFARPAMTRILKRLEEAGTTGSKTGKKTITGQKAKELTDFQAEMAQYVQVLPQKKPAEVIAEMEHDFVGLDSVKNSARKLVYLDQFKKARGEKGMANADSKYSEVLLGNPGLGKTTWARKKAELLIAMGVSGPRYVEVSRENMVGGFVGHTEKNMTALFSMADIVFIDEAYNLTDGNARSNDFGRHVISALLIALENKPSLTIFMAGYSAEMEQLLQSNPGLRSRISRFENFEDMSVEQLGGVLDHKLKTAGFEIEPEARAHALAELAKAKDEIGPKNFGNARLVRNIVEQLPEAMAERLYGPDADSSAHDEKALKTVTAQDMAKLDFRKILGTGTLAPEQESPYSGRNIGFGATLRQDRKSVSL